MTANPPKQQNTKHILPRTLDDSPEMLGAALASRRPELVQMLSPSQQKVLHMLLGGMSEPMIVQSTGRSKHTVHDHVKTIYRKYNIQRRVQLVLRFTTPE